MSLLYIVASGICTVLSGFGLQWWVLSFLAKNGVSLGDTGRAVVLISGSGITVALLVNLAVNAYILLILCLKIIFFKQLYPSESRKVFEQLVNYIIYKGSFLPLIVPPHLLQMVFWSVWLVVLCSLKMFQSLAKDRLERLNASPTTTPSKCFRVYSALLLVLAVDLFWLRMCMVAYTSFSSSLFLLSFFEPFSIAFEALLVINLMHASPMAVMVHGCQLIETWHRHSVDNGIDCFASIDFCKSTAGSLAEWKEHFIRNCGFLLEMMTLLMAVGHYLMIWWLHGMTFHLVDGIIFLNLRAILSAIMKRMRAFIKLKKALNSLDGALPDGTNEELSSFNDECAICRGPMARAKKLPCDHLFHLACLRSWLDQGLAEVYSCPTCRRPLFPSTSQSRTNSPAQETQNDVQLTEQVNLRLDHGHVSPTTAFSNQQLNPSDPSWRVGFDSGWVPPWTNSRMDGASTSGALGSVGLSGVQMMVRQLASVSESYAHGSGAASSWNLWPSRQVGSSLPESSHGQNVAALRLRSASPPRNLLRMVERVREVLPHMPDELIIQDLLRTNNINITVNNLLMIQ